jgi:hypothetical protein
LQRSICGSPRPARMRLAFCFAAVTTACSTAARRKTR